MRYKYNHNHDPDDGRFASGGGGEGGSGRFTSEHVAQIDEAIRAGDKDKLREIRARLMADDSLRASLRHSYRDKIDEALAKSAPGAHMIYR